MDETIVMVAIAPVYAIVMGAVIYCFAFGYYQLRKLDQSADETAVTEKTNPVLIPGTQSAQSTQTK